MRLFAFARLHRAGDYFAARIAFRRQFRLELVIHKCDCTEHAAGKPLTGGRGNGSMAGWGSVVGRRSLRWDVGDLVGIWEMWFEIWFGFGRCCCDLRDLVRIWDIWQGFWKCGSDIGDLVGIWEI